MQTPQPETSQATSDPDDLLERLNQAFTGFDESFLSEFRHEFIWNQAKFNQLIRDMQQICENRSGQELIERWLADGFWYLPNFVKSWSAHPEFPKANLPANFQLMCELLEDLAHWFFTDDCPWEAPESWLALTLKD